MYAYQPAEISYPREKVSAANCTISPSLPAGLAIDSSQCTISGTPTTPTSQTSYTVTANINNTTYQGTVLLATSYYPMEPSVSGSDAKIGSPIDDITFQIDPTVGSGSGSVGISANDDACHSSSCSGDTWFGTGYDSDYGVGPLDFASMAFGEKILTIPSTGIDFATEVDSNGHVHMIYNGHSSHLA